MTEISKLTILTGAGFTRNFGGFLAEEMWAKIFNQPEISGDKDLRVEFIKERDLNFERVYTNVMSKESEDCAEKKRKFTDAMMNTYSSLDRAIRSVMQGGRKKCNVPEIFQALFELLDSNDGMRSIWFTLNQDLFLEKWWGAHSLESTFGNGGLIMPCATRFQDSLYMTNGNISPETDILREHFVQLNSDVTLEKVKRVLKNDHPPKAPGYIKLHGSFGWWTSKNVGCMAVGEDKDVFIQNESLLDSYSKLFREHVLQSGIKLLIIGYGFGDEHINDILLEGAKIETLKMYIINPESPKLWKNKIANLQKRGAATEKYYLPIWNGIYGYFQNSLGDIFDNHKDNENFKELKRIFLS